ncbi:MAG TPA: hypothetical protein VK866_12970 [Acidimicrobiales bacterium]|nr:hypothetical protein [Acidimicrobiales bacterium]
MSGHDRATRVRAWWEARTFIGDVTLGFTAVTVVNSAMMLTGLDEPKVGTFAYVHLLGRLGIVTVVVGLFYLDELRDALARGFRGAGRLRRQRRPRRATVDAMVRSAARAPVESAARVFTAAVAATSVVTVALAWVDVRTPAGGDELYGALVIVAGLLLVATGAASWRWRRRLDPA